MDQYKQYYHLFVKNRSVLTRSLSVIILIWIAFQIRSKVQSMDWSVPTGAKTEDLILAIGAVVVLMIFNWGIETCKWYLLVSPWKPISIKEAFEDVMRGTALGMVTPANIGDYGGRLIRYSKEEIKRGLFSNFVSSMIQNSIHLSFGVIVLSYWLLHISEVQVIYSMVGNAFGLGLLWWLLGRLFSSIFAGRCTQSLSSKVYFLALLRYAVFVFQYVLILQSLAVALPYVAQGLGVMLIYGIQSGLPLPGWLDVLARGEIALWVWGEQGVQVVSILIATYLLWLINKVFPAVIGSVLIWKAKINVQ